MDGFLVTKKWMCYLARSELYPEQLMHIKGSDCCNGTCRLCTLSMLDVWTCAIADDMLWLGSNCEDKHTQRRC